LAYRDDAWPNCHQGLYRTTLDGFGECAIVHLGPGDGVLFLPRANYEALYFLPSFDALPAIEHWEQVGLLTGRVSEDPMIG
jgi:hypothetical protein